MTRTKLKTLYTESLTAQAKIRSNVQYKMKHGITVEARNKTTSKVEKFKNKATTISILSLNIVHPTVNKKSKTKPLHVSFSHPSNSQRSNSTCKLNRETSKTKTYYMT